MRRGNLFLIIFFALLLGIFLLYHFRGRVFHSTRLASLPAGQCDASIWSHVYHSYRLQVLNPCTSVTGTIYSIRPEADGDDHIDVTLDPGYESFLNNGNVTGQHGKLVVEPVCQNPVTQADAAASCSAYQQNVFIPQVGDHVRITGAFVLDQDHGWQEIHPVTSIEIM